MNMRCAVSIYARQEAQSIKPVPDDGNGLPAPSRRLKRDFIVQTVIVP